MDLGKEIKREIKKQGLKQKQVAKLIGISNNAMSQICLCKSFPSKTTLAKLCSVLKIKIEFSIENDETFS